MDCLLCSQILHFSVDEENLLGLSELHKLLSITFFPETGTRSTLYSCSVSLASIRPAYQTVRHVITEDMECFLKRIRVTEVEDLVSLAFP